MTARRTVRLVAAACLCAACVIVPTAAAGSDLPSGRGTISEAALHTLRALRAGGDTAPSAPAGAAFTVSAPSVTLSLPVPTHSITVVGRTATVTGQHWHPGAEVTIVNSSLASVAGDQRAAGPWDGQVNGALDEAYLCDLETNPGHSLRCDAAAAFDAMASAFEDDLGKPLRLTDSYRTLAVQVALKETKPDLAATPGRSNHGYGLAVDLAGRAADPDAESGQWLAQHAAEYGWTLPVWARPDGAKPEPWHWEYVGGDPRPVTVRADREGSFSLDVPYLRGGDNLLAITIDDQHYVVTATG